MTTMRVEDPGPLTTVQDQGRRLAHLGVPESGALDPGALRLANRLVGNPDRAAGLETTGGGLRLLIESPVVLAVTGAPAALRVDGVAGALATATYAPAGSQVALDAPVRGLRSYVAVRGGIVDREVLGSSSTDLLSHLGRPLASGDQLRVGSTPESPVPRHDPVPWTAALPPVDPLRVVLGPRDHWFTAEALTRLTTAAWTVGSRSNRVGLRLEGEPLARAVDVELPSEGTVAGSIQVPPSGHPVLFLADHPVTGGYPVIAVVVTTDLPRLAQAAPGSTLRFRATPGPELS